MIKEYIKKISENGEIEDMEKLSDILEEVIYIVKDYDNNKFIEYKEVLKDIANKEDNKMNDMRTERGDYVGGYRNDYHGADYREDYRNDYRGNNREDYREYDMRGGRMNNRSRRSYRNYREEDIYEEIEDAMYDAKECHRKFEDMSEMTDDPKIKNTLMKIAMREKEHYDSLKELLEK